MKRVFYLLLTISFAMIMFGLLVHLLDIHIFWESLYLGLLLLIPAGFGLLYLATKTAKTKAAGIGIGFMTLYSLVLLTVLFTTYQSKEIANYLALQTEVTSQIGGFQRLVLSFPARGRVKGHSLPRIKSAVYLVKGYEKYGLVREYSKLMPYNYYVIDTAILVPSLDVSAVPYETREALNKRWGVEE